MHDVVTTKVMNCSAQKWITEDVSEYNRFGKTVFMLMVILLELIWVSRSTNYAGEARLTCLIL